MSFITYIHIITGTIAVLSGAVALFAKKGGPLHRKSGKLFYGTMVPMAVSGAIMGLFIPDVLTVIAGLFTGYLITTAWIAVTRKTKRPGWPEFSGLIFVSVIAVSSLLLGLEALQSEARALYGYPPEPYFFFTGLAFLAAGLDIHLCARRGLPSKHMVARHLWRMCFAYFIAAGSLFTGPGAVAFPKAIQETGILSLPEPIILLLMVYWLVRTLFVKRRKKAKAEVPEMIG